MPGEQRTENRQASTGTMTIGMALYLLDTASPAASPASAARPTLGCSMVRNDSHTVTTHIAAISVSTPIFSESSISGGEHATSTPARTATQGEAVSLCAIPTVATSISRLKNRVTERTHMTMRGCDAVLAIRSGAVISILTIS